MQNEQHIHATQTHTLSHQMLHMLNVLQMDIQSLSEYSQECYEENPALEQIPPVLSDPPHTSKTGRINSRSVQTKSASAAADMLEQIEQPITINDYLIKNVGFLPLDSETLRVARLLAQLAGNDGYIRSDLERFALDIHADPVVVEHALEALQTLDPPGICARNLSECLLLQLKRQGGNDHVLVSIAQNYLHDVAAKNYSVIAKAHKTSEKHVRDCVNLLRTLNPWPCPSDVTDKINYITPDISILPDDNNELKIIYYDDYYPNFRVDPTYKAFAKSISGSDRKFIQQFIRTASQFVKALEMRRTTLERVVNLIVRYQSNFLIHNGALRPLSYNDIAQALGVHESTVYRAVCGKNVLCSSGVKPLSSFFQRDIAGGGSVNEAQRMIKKICSEHPNISDQGIAGIMKDHGLPLARRTIAKYRSQMGIFSSYQRVKP